MKLNENERRVLAVLAENGSEGFGYYGFGAIEDAGVRLDRGAIRRACRSLARKGLSKYGRGLWTEDGDMRGAGYAATTEGKALMQQSAA